MSIAKRKREEKSYIIEEMHKYGILLDTREIFLHGHIDDEEDPGVEFRMANTFLKNIQLLKSNGDGPIIVHQHSVGGEWATGMMMYDAICHSVYNVCIIMHGYACSMGSIVPQAADLRIIMPHCRFMVHDGYTDIDQGLTYKQAGSWRELEEKDRKTMIAIYITVCRRSKFFKGKTDTQIKNYLIQMFDKKEDWWMDAQEAVDYGFADVIYGTKGYSSLEEIKNSLTSELK
jgi:ATP-dependent protease ClpP protease subunit